MLAQQQNAAGPREGRLPGLAVLWRRAAASFGLNGNRPAVALAYDGEAAPAAVPDDDPPAPGLHVPGHGATFHLPHFLKYLVIGGIACGIDIVLFLILHNLTGFAPLAAHSISVPLSVLFSFCCNAALNFRTTDYLALRFLSFVVVAFVGYLAGAMVIEARWLLGIDANLAKIVSLPLVFVVQYLLNSQISFRKTAATAP